MQGLNLTPLHGHTALFGVYGLLGIGLMLFCLRGLKPHVHWNEAALKTCFWALNIGLAGMALLTLLPIGMIQLNAAIDQGYWYARSAELMQQPLIQLLVWMRVPGDTIFSVGALGAGMVRPAIVDGAAARATATLPQACRLPPGRRPRMPEDDDHAGGAAQSLLARHLHCDCWPRRRIVLCFSSVRPTSCWRWMVDRVADRCALAGDGPAAARSGGWIHAIVMQYQVLPSFMFGFLLTVFPRWMNLPALTRWHYVPVGMGLFGGQALTLAAAIGGLRLFKFGAWLTIAGWSTGTLILANLIRRCSAHLACGQLRIRARLRAAGIGVVRGVLADFDGRLMFAAIKLGGTALLLPIFFTVCHRMIPFFAGSVIAGYRPVRPLWALAAFWAS